MEDECEGLVGINEAGRLVGLSTNALQGAVARGELRRVLAGKRMLFDPAAVLEWKQARESGWDHQQREIEESQERARVQDQEARERCARQAAAESKAVIEREAARRALASNSTALLDEVVKLRAEVADLRAALLAYQQYKDNGVSDAPGGSDEPKPKVAVRSAKG